MEGLREPLLSFFPPLLALSNLLSLSSSPSRPDSLLSLSRPRSSVHLLFLRLSSFLLPFLLPVHRFCN